MEKVSLRRDGQRFSASQRNSGIDFHDVFGGPPRSSSSMQEHMHEDETSKWRSSWSCSGTSSEKPVFGEQHVNRRRYTNDYFFDDIFDAEKQHLDSPGSRVISPVRPLPPNVEPFAPSSLPAKFSLPANLSKAVNLPAFGSAARSTYKTADCASNGTQYSSTPDISPPRYSSEVYDSREELMNDVRSYRPSPLSRQISLNSEESMISDISDKGDKSRKDVDSENKKSSSQFHFSIYKWAGIGVPSLIPIRAGINSRLKEKTKVERSSSFRSWIASKSSTDNLQNPNDSAVADTLAADKDSSRMNYGEDGSELFNDGCPEHIVEIQQTDQKSDPSITANMNSSSLGRGNDIPKKHTSEYAGTKEGSQSLPERVAARKTDEEISVEAQKSEARSLNTLFYNEENDRGSNRISSKSEVKEDKRKSIKKSSVVNSKQKKQAGEDSTQINEQVNKSSLHGTSIKKGNDEGVRKVKGKVKDFVKNFNQEASSSSEVKIDSGSPTNRCTNGTSKKLNKGSVDTTKTNDKMQAPNVKAKKMFTNASMKADEYLKESVNRDSAKKTNDHVPNDTYVGQKDSSASNTASIPDRFKATEGVPGEYFCGSYQVNDVFQAEDEPPKKDEDKAIDTKIRKWSNGKEGNIRSLLSTLQYVLWPESGWKPVPLVDIIEGNAVKKAYQKALLCLHPDKLQQKGASSHQKYIAEKVFDILQEAWDHFNSLNAF